MTSNASPASDRKRPFWKEPMMWVVLGIPLASIVAGVGLVVVSVRSGSADAVMDKVDRVSQIQTTDLGPDEAAAARKLSAIVQIRADPVELVPVTGEFAGTSPLVLTLALRRRDPSPRWKAVVEPAPGRFTHHLEMYAVDQIDEQVQIWLREAWEGAA